MSTDDVIENGIKQSEWERLASDLENRPASEIAEILERLEDPQCAAICRRLGAEKFAEIFAHFESEKQSSVAKQLSDEELSRLLTNLRPDDRTRFLEDLPQETADKLLHFLSGQEFAECRQLLAYPKESVGRLMTPEVIQCNRFGRSNRPSRTFVSRGRKAKL